MKTEDREPVTHSSGEEGGLGTFVALLVAGAGLVGLAVGASEHDAHTGAAVSLGVVSFGLLLIGLFGLLDNRRCLSGEHLTGLCVLGVWESRGGLAVWGLCSQGGRRLCFSYLKDREPEGRVFALHEFRDLSRPQFGVGWCTDEDLDASGS